MTRRKRFKPQESRAARIGPWCRMPSAATVRCRAWRPRETGSSSRRLAPRATTGRQSKRHIHCDQDYETIGDDLGKHDLRRNDWHDEQMLDRTLLTPPDERRAGQDHRQHGDVVDDLHDGGKPIAYRFGLNLARIARLTGVLTAPSRPAWNLASCGAMMVWM